MPWTSWMQLLLWERGLIVLSRDKPQHFPRILVFRPLHLPNAVKTQVWIAISVHVQVNASEIRKYAKDLHVQNSTGSGSHAFRENPGKILAADDFRSHSENRSDCRLNLSPMSRDSVSKENNIRFLYRIKRRE
jgi:hypothetical protein